MLARVKSKLRQVDETQESIQSLSTWLIRHRDDADKIAVVWRDEVLEGEHPCCQAEYLSTKRARCYQQSARARC